MIKELNHGAHYDVNRFGENQLTVVTTNHLQKKKIDVLEKKNHK